MRNLKMAARVVKTGTKKNVEKPDKKLRKNREKIN